MKWWTFTSNAALSGQIAALQKEFSTKFDQLKGEVTKMSPAMQALTDQVRSNTKVVESAKALIQGFANSVQAVKEDPAAIQALVDEMKGEDQTLSDAVAANTPAAAPAINTETPVGTVTTDGPVNGGTAPV